MLSSLLSNISLRSVLFLSVLFQIIGRLFILVLFAYSFGPGHYCKYYRLTLPYITYLTLLTLQYLTLPQTRSSSSSRPTSSSCRPFTLSSATPRNTGRKEDFLISPSSTISLEMVWPIFIFITGSGKRFSFLIIIFFPRKEISNYYSIVLPFVFCKSLELKALAKFMMRKMCF